VKRQLERQYGVSLDLTQEGQCLMFGRDRHMVAQAKAAVMDLVANVVNDFGVIVELLRKKEGILCVSELIPDDDGCNDPIRNHPGGASGFVKDRLRLGQEVEVLCTSVDPVQGTIRLSRKALLELREKQLGSS
jgi:ribosomal protein S1